MRLTFILFLLTFSTNIFAQTFSHEISTHIGRIVRHNQRLTLPIDHNSWGLEYALEYQTFGQKQWHRWAQYPRLGIAFSFQDFGNAQELGLGFGIVPYIGTDFWRSKTDKVRIFGRLSLGFGYVTEHYDVATNPRNNFIGTHFSNCSIFKIGADIRLYPQWRLRPSISFTHYSSGSWKIPNYGINVLALQIGLLYTPNSTALTALPQKPNYNIEKGAVEEKPIHRNRYVLSMNFGMGMRETMTDRGPRYPLYYANIEVAKFLSNLVRWRAGLDYDYITSIEAFLNNKANYDPREAKWQAMRFAISGGLEYVWNRVSLSTQVGIYLTQNELQPRPFYIRLLVRVYPFNSPLSTKRQFNPYLTIGLKTHMITAEYASFGLGFNI